MDAAVDGDLRDVAVLAEMDRDLRALLAACGWRQRSTGIRMELPDWLDAALPSEACRAVVRLRTSGRSWREIERETGVGAGNAAVMAGSVARVARLWPWAVAGRRAGMGRREIARRFGLPRWGVKVICEHAPPDGDAGRAWPECAPCPVATETRENGRTPAVGRSLAPRRPPAEVAWRVLRTEAGCALRAKAEIERRCEARFGSGWRSAVRCIAAVAASGRPGGRRPTAAAPYSCEGLLAIQATDAVELDELLEGLPHARGWVGRSAADAGVRGRCVRRLPLLVSTAEVAAWFGRLGWEGIPEARS